MSSTLSQKIAALVDQKVDASSSLTDLVAAAGAAASISASRKAEMERRTLFRQVRLETLKSFGTFAVPIVSLLTLFGTVFVQGLQLQATRQQNEDTQFRELLVAAKESLKDDASDITFAPRLKSFFASDRYADQAREVAKRLMGKTAYEPGFRDLFNTVIGEVSIEKLPDTLDIARSLHATMREIDLRCVEASTPYRDKISVPQTFAHPAASQTFANFGLCASAAMDEEVVKVTAGAKDAELIFKLRRSSAEVRREMQFVTRQIREVLKKEFYIGSPRQFNRSFDLSYVFLFDSDLTEIDFSAFQLEGTSFAYVQLDRSRITPTRQPVTPPTFANSAWWNADRMSFDMLKIAASYAQPYYAEGLAYPNDEKPTPESYAARLNALCGEKTKCGDIPRLFGPARTPIE